ncbi:VOC family protein [Gordonia sp. ABSL11-1]|uniref:VOC family protein n=1 Tax=Gordonia sp. ABSL11-1 TaxID=3053924 RepID=UPI002573D5F2|nr:VOC family protein [Gordonia sp. ABSL11-1]MDL9945099.1 VOC family protein [Gordonia sp. ABSL11-1]
MNHVATFDHLIHWVDDLDTASASYESAGIPVTPALTMPGFRNAAWGIDDERYVELACVDDWNAVESSPYGESLAILRPAVEALRGPGPLTFAVHVPDARAVASRLRASGHAVEEVDVHLHDRDAGFVEVFASDAPTHFPFFITYDPPRADIARMRADHRRAHGISFDGRPDLIALLIGSTAPDADAVLLGEFIGCQVRGRTVELPGAELRLTDDAPRGLYGIAVRDPNLRDSRPVDVSGMSIVHDG